MQDMEDRTRQDKPGQKRGAPLLLTSPAIPRWPDHTLRLADRATSLGPGQSGDFMSSHPKGFNPMLQIAKYDLAVTTVMSE